MQTQAETLSIRETMKGFFTKAILASVLSARNSCISSLAAISDVAQSCCNRPQTSDGGGAAEVAPAPSGGFTHFKKGFQKSFPGLDLLAVHVPKRHVGEHFLGTFHA